MLYGQQNIKTRDRWLWSGLFCGHSPCHFYYSLFQIHFIRQIRKETHNPMCIYGCSCNSISVSIINF